ncbi:Hypothetical_protein [Hexamita inflata]|uniref:Hypothetical_protein n=1 Tax=Hexamita inflata TaxID=28002 RepID=A0AA86QZJ8_9EUKA|nr:Hypothetical protein HINF_LOCUS53922 [Hexamita inflata]
MSQLQGQCNELIIDLCQSNVTELEIFQNAYKNFALCQNIKLMNYKIDLEQITGNWQSIVCINCNICQTNPNTVFISIQHFKVVNSQINLDYLKAACKKLELVQSKVQCNMNNVMIIEELILKETDINTPLNIQHIEANSSKLIIGTETNSLKVTNCDVQFKLNYKYDFLSKILWSPSQL